MRAADGGGEAALFSTVNEQLLLLATVVGAVAALPALIEFLVERRKRRERIALSLEDVEVATLKPRLAGMDDLLAGIADLIDRARHPREYASLEVGNEILIVGPSLSGKKTLAHVIAKQAQIERLVTVYNPRNPDALAKAKSIIGREQETKMMLLLPRVDQAFEKEDEEVLTELEALIETTSEKANVLVVGTATSIVPGQSVWKNLARGLVEALVGVGAEVVALGLEQVGRQALALR
jgi:ribose 1,5-bisphosphokinase PhnN